MQVKEERISMLAKYKFSNTQSIAKHPRLAIESNYDKKGNLPNTIQLANNKERGIKIEIKE